jgi:hypothetical protein
MVKVGVKDLDWGERVSVTVTVRFKVRVGVKG